MKAFGKSVIATRRMTQGSKKVQPPSKPQQDPETHFEVEVEEERSAVHLEPDENSRVKPYNDQGRWVRQTWSSETSCVSFVQEVDGVFL